MSGICMVKQVLMEKLIKNKRFSHEWRLHGPKRVFRRSCDREADSETSLARLAFAWSKASLSRQVWWKAD